MIPVSFLQTSREKLAYKYHSVDSQPTLMFLPGFASDMSGNKATYLESLALEKGWGYLSLDYSGHGQSGGEFTDGTIGHWANNARDVILHTQAQNLVIVGSSMGGWIMLITALALPDRIKGLIGIAAAPDFTEYRVWNAMTPAERDVFKHLGRLIVPSDYTGEGLTITYQLIEEARNHLLLDKPIEISAPVRLLQGMLDEDVPPSHTMKLMEKLNSPDVQTILIKDGDHRLSRPHQLKILANAIVSVL
jgi:pimeloyl-ACP methyl ester carboxylesterase